MISGSLTFPSQLSKLYTVAFDCEHMTCTILVGNFQVKHQVTLCVVVFYPCRKRRHSSSSSEEEWSDNSLERSGKPGYIMVIKTIFIFNYRLSRIA